MSVRTEEQASASRTWVLERLAVGPAYRFPLMLGVARAVGLWNAEEECYAAPESEIVALADDVLAALVAEGVVQAISDDRGQGPRYELAKEKMEGDAWSPPPAPPHCAYGPIRRSDEWFAIVAEGYERGSSGVVMWGRRDWVCAPAWAEGPVYRAAYEDGRASIALMRAFPARTGGGS